MILLVVTREARGSSGWQPIHAGVNPNARFESKQKRKYSYNYFPNNENLKQNAIGWKSIVL